VKHTFALRLLACSRCKATRTPSRWSSACPECGGGHFTVEIERSAAGIEVTLEGGGGGGWAGLVFDDDEGAGITRYRTHSFLRCRDVSGDEIAEFMGASLDRRKRLYIGWKRREVEHGLGHDHAICDRCRVAFKVYPNKWNPAGFCSKSCHAAEMKSRGS
jgi:hypothetical protein